MIPPEWCADGFLRNTVLVLMQVPGSLVTSPCGTGQSPVLVGLENSVGTLKHFLKMQLCGCLKIKVGAINGPL